jgi:hypothetical protein
VRRIPAIAIALSAILLAPGAVRAQDTTTASGTVTLTIPADSSPEAKAQTEMAAKQAEKDAKKARKEAEKAAKAKQEADKNRLTPAEIEQANLPTAYELVDRLRRPWLRRDAVTGGDVVVYMDEQNIGGPEKLRDLPAVDVAELQYLPNDQAVRRWGAAIQGSVIVVLRRR